VIDIKQFQKRKKILMILLVKKFFNNEFIIFLRNLFGIRKIDISVAKLKNPTSISDAFCWRTDNNFTTVFKYSDILSNFYNIENSLVTLNFYTKKNNLIKSIIIENLNETNELIIDKKFLNGIEDYGVFYIFHSSKKKINENIIISNRCYLGYSKNMNLPSFVHGNTLAKYQSINMEQKGTNLIKNSLFLNQIYRVQTFFAEYSNSEAFFVNPTSKIVKFKINNKKYLLNSGCSILINITDINNLEIKSNCLFLRPTIFNYKNKYIDVFHS
jgi:hypothetical protein